MNEFRNSMKDQANTYFTKVEHEAWKEKIESEIQILREFKIILDAKASQRSLVYAYVVTGIGLLLSIIGLMINIIDKV
jgi:hypothetical protein